MQTVRNLIVLEIHLYICVWTVAMKMWVTANQRFIRNAFIRDLQKKLVAMIIFCDHTLTTLVLI